MTLNPSLRNDGKGPHLDAADHRLAAQVAARAGRLLVEHRRALPKMASEIGRFKDEADRLSNGLIMEMLSHRIDAGDALLSEERPDDLVRLRSSRVWIVDPLDGTREFSEPSRVDWAVHVGLCVDGEPQAGAVSLPALGEVWSTGTHTFPKIGAASSRIVVSRTRPPPVALWLAEQLGGSLVEMGSAGAKAMAVLKGEADIYLHAGGQYEWDSCAPVAVSAAAGLHASRLDGSPLRYNQPDPYLPDLLICKPELSQRALSTLSAYGVDGSGE